MAINVLVVDDSALVRSVLSEIINNAPDLRLVGTAKDAYEAKNMVNLHQPDVITLDIQMPKVSGLVFLEKLMQAKPTPVVMISTLTEEGATETLRALELGAIDYVAKPKLSVSQGLNDYSNILLDKIRAASKVRLNTVTPRARQPIKSLSSVGAAGTNSIVGIGASTGGTEAIKTVLLGLPPTFPPVVITQHMPPGFTRSFAERLNSLVMLQVKEAAHGDILKANHVYIAPGDRHIIFDIQGSDVVIKLDNRGPVSGHQPSVDVMFDSLASVAGRKCVAALLTGMGKDGAEGLLKIKRGGGKTYAQDEQSSVVYGMPAAAVDLNAALESIPLSNVAEMLVRATQTR